MKLFVYNPVNSEYHVEITYSQNKFVCVDIVQVYSTKGLHGCINVHVLTRIPLEHAHAWPLKKINIIY